MDEKVRLPKLSFSQKELENSESRLLDEIKDYVSEEAPFWTAVPAGTSHRIARSKSTPAVDVRPPTPVANDFEKIYQKQIARVTGVPPASIGSKEATERELEGRLRKAIYALDDILNYGPIHRSESAAIRNSIKILTKHLERSINNPESEQSQSEPDGYDW